MAEPSQAPVLESVSTPRAGEEDLSVRNDIDELLADAMKRLSENPDPAVEIELGQLIELIVRLRDIGQFEDYVRMKCAMTALTAEKPNFVLVQALRNELELQTRRSEHGFVSWMLRRVCSSSSFRSA